MRKLLSIIIAVFCIAGCVDLTTDSLGSSTPYGYHYKHFGVGTTKSMTTVSWVEGDRVCIYSLGEDDLVLYKDTVEITDVNRSTGKITALVDDKSEKYFAVYPYNAIKSEVGEMLDDEDFRIVMSGKFADVSVMTQYIDTAATDIWMHNRFSLLNINTKNYYGTVTIDSAFPSVSEVSKGNEEYWIPISYKNETVSLKIETPGSGRNNKTIVREATFDVEPGAIYYK